MYVIDMTPNFLINTQGPNRLSKIMMTKLTIVLIGVLHALALGLCALKKSTTLSGLAPKMLKYQAWQLTVNQVSFIQRPVMVLHTK